MNLAYNNYSEMSMDDLFEKMLPTIENVYKSYEYTGISFDEYSDIVIRVLARNRDSSDFISSIKKNIKKEVDLEVKKLLFDKDKSFDIVSRYIGKQFPRVSNYEEAIKTFRKLDAFFKKYDFVLDVNSLTKLIESNDKFSAMINYVFDEKREDIVKGNSNDIFDSDFLVFSVLTYCSLKDIKVEENVEALNAKDFYDTNSKDIEIDIIREKISNLNIPQKVEERIENELKKYELLSSLSPETSVVKNYIDWLVSLPWNTYTEDNKNLKEVKEKLDKTHYGLEKIKKRIIEHLAVKQMSSDIKSPIICLVGPPGVGKTSLANSIAKAINRNFVKISVGGINDEAEIIGHRKTYLGSSPGRIIQRRRSIRRRKRRAL